VGGAYDGWVHLLKPAAGFALGTVACVVALAAASAAAADDYQRHFRPKDQAAAKAAVLHETDFGTVAVTGGPSTVPHTDEKLCSYFDPKESDLVVTGEAMTIWASPAFEVRSVVSMLATPRMVNLDWTRSYEPAAFVRCLRELIQKSLGSHGKVVSATRLSYPKIGDRAAGVRLVMDVKQASGGSVRMMLDSLWVAQGRTEIVLMVTVPYMARAAVKKTEVQLARLMASRLTLSA
jgi:hypothetical protein